MKVFVKRYPNRGEFPKEDNKDYCSNVGMVYFRKDKFYLRDEQLITFTDKVEWFLEEIELPNAEDIRREALGPFKEKDLEDQYGDFIQDDIDTFTKGANYILNLLN